MITKINYFNFIYNRLFVLLKHCNYFTNRLSVKSTSGNPRDASGTECLRVRNTFCLPIIICII